MKVLRESSLGLKIYHSGEQGRSSRLFTTQFVPRKFLGYLIGYVVYIIRDILIHVTDTLLRTV
jgi:hypothetical protein